MVISSSSLIMRPFRRGLLFDVRDLFAFFELLSFFTRFFNGSSSSSLFDSSSEFELICISPFSNRSRAFVNTD